MYTERRDLGIGVVDVSGGEDGFVAVGFCDEAGILVVAAED